MTRKEEGTFTQPQIPTHQLKDRIPIFNKKMSTPGKQKEEEKQFKGQRISTVNVLMGQTEYKAQRGAQIQ